MTTVKPTILTLYNESEKFLDVYPEYNLLKLPRWVQDNIQETRVYGNQKKGIILPDGKKYHLDNKLNDITGREWTFFINSVFSTHYPTGLNLTHKYLDKEFPICKQYIQFFKPFPI